MNPNLSRSSSSFRQSSASRSSLATVNPYKDFSIPSSSFARNLLGSTSTHQVDYYTQSSSSDDDSDVDDDSDTSSYPEEDSVSDLSSEDDSDVSSEDESDLEYNPYTQEKLTTTAYRPLPPITTSAHSPGKRFAQRTPFTMAQESLTSKVRPLTSILANVKEKMESLHLELLQIAQQKPWPGQLHAFSQKQTEYQLLQLQFNDLENQHRQKRALEEPWRLSPTPFEGTSFDPHPQRTPSIRNPPTQDRATSSRTRLFHDDDSMVASSAPIAILPIGETDPISTFVHSLASRVESAAATSVAPIIKNEDSDLPLGAFEHLSMKKHETTVERKYVDTFTTGDAASTKQPRQQKKKEQHFTFEDIPPFIWENQSVEMLNWCSAEPLFANPAKHTVHTKSLNALAKPCENQKFLTEFEKTSRKLQLFMCETNSPCQSPHTEKKFQYKDFKKPYKETRDRRWKYLEKKSYRRRSPDRCYISNRKRHLAPNCKNKNFSDNLSIEEHLDTTVFMIKPLEVSQASQSQNTKPHRTKILSLQRSQPTPIAKVHLLTSTYSRPIPVIAFFDTGAAVSILNPDVLPQSYWRPHYQHFLAASGDTFVIDKISVPIFIRLFPKCVVKHRLLGSSSHGKDLLIGFDILYKLPRLWYSEQGLRYKSFLNPWSPIPNLYMASTLSMEDIKKEIILSSCASNHLDFLTKNDSPLWLNPSFFVNLPFKQNEDVNPTKASHPGMNPDHLQLAVQECSELVSQGIIETTTSPWACEAFYVNKRSEQVRGKLRLVINYQPLNHFLADDKFPLPQKRSLFQSLTNARILSKFDLKAGFWQLGIHPDDRPKTAFCIPDHHYQWNVMPFGLKNAPSVFQKAMTKIFEPILQHALVYIDDILLFSPDEDSHVKLLSEFHSIVKKHGIMLSENKMVIGVRSIDFLGMQIADGKYQPQPHISQELHRFPDEMSSQKEIQQFLGLVNYMADFLPKLSCHTVHLFPMLKKGPPPWSEKQTSAVKAIKQLADVMPPLKIPTATDKRILQTDASDDSWGAVLLVEDKSGPRTICGYKSGTFKDSEKHYHSTFKEILAVKRGIEKFQFHLIGHDFQIEMDMSSFPRMLQFKRKMLPEAQLLRWANWFSQWKFTVRHIKGSENILADFLSRPKGYKSHIQKEVQQVLPHKIIPMIFPITPADTSDSSAQHNVPNTSRPSSQTISDVLPSMALPTEVLEVITDLTFRDRSQLHYRTFFTILLRKHGLFMRNLLFHPDYPFLNIFHFHDLYRFPKEALCFFWYLFEAHTTAITFNAPKLVQYLFLCQFGHVPRQAMGIFILLQWFLPAHLWIPQLSVSKKKYALIMFHRPCSAAINQSHCGTSSAAIIQPHSIVYHSPSAYIHEWSNRNCASRSFEKNYPDKFLTNRLNLANANSVDPCSIPANVLLNEDIWSSGHPISSLWITTMDQWSRTHLCPKIDTSDESGSDSDGYSVDYNE